MLTADEQRFGYPLPAIRGSLLLADDDLDGAREQLARTAAPGTGSDSLVVAARALAKQSQLEFAAGSWDDAVVLAERAQALATESDEVAPRALAGWAAVLVPAARGEWDACARSVRALRTLRTVFEDHEATVAIAVAEVAAARGLAAEVLDALSLPATLECRDMIDDPGHWPWAHLYADALTKLGRLDEADAFLRRQERSVARLAASGLSNRAVAAELLLSVKTVERHLTHVYRKLGVNSRSALGARLD